MNQTTTLTVDPADPTPPYEQLRRQLHDLISSGALAEGYRLPPVRQLAGDLGLAVGTVARTYRELEQAGLVTTRRAAGTRVADNAAQPLDVLAELTGQYLRRARALGYTDHDIDAAIQQDRARGTSVEPGPSAKASVALEALPSGT
jgi:DNA-binding transcriptional regulator YhcF (GntR family)